MPTRSRVLHLNRYLRLPVYRANGDLATVNEANGSLNVTQTRTTGGDIPDYKYRISLGLGATTALSGRIVKVKNPGMLTYNCINMLAVGGSIKQCIGFGPLPVAGHISWPGHSGINLTTVENDAKVAFVRKVKAVNRSFQGGIFLGELTEAIRMIKNPARALRGGLDDYLASLKKRKSGLNRVPPRRREATAQDIVSNTWLEYSFGWTPLINDIQNGVEAVQKWAKDENRPYLVPVSAYGEQSALDSAKGAVTGTLLDIKYDRSITIKANVRFYGTVRTFNPKSQPFRHWGVSLSDVAPTIWELVPWSFLVDYFSNIGDIVDCATFVRSSLGWVNRAELKLVNDKFNAYTLPGTSTFVRYVVGGDAEFECREVNRSVYLGSFVPTLEFQIPGTGKKWANIAALLPALKSLTPFR